MIWNNHFDQVEIRTKVDGKIFSSDTKKTARRSLVIAKASFISIENDSSQKVNEAPKIFKEEDTAVLLLKVKCSSKTYIVQLLDKTYNVIKSTTNTPDIRFENIQPGGYLIRLITDLNNNGHQDFGNFHLKEQPEPVHFYRTEKGDLSINLKANWEVGPLLITD